MVYVWYTYFCNLSGKVWTGEFMRDWIGALEVLERFKIMEKIN